MSSETCTTEGVLEGGFSLIDIVVALTVLVLGLIPLSGLLASTSSYRAETETDYRLHLLAVNQLERVKQQGNSASGYLTLYPGGEGTFTIPARDVTGLPISDLEGQITAEPTQPGVSTTVALTVTIAYTDGRGDAREQTVSTYVNKEAP